MEPRLLQYFVAVAEELNFSRAAQRLHVSQPAVSRQIRQLEQTLGVQLFERMGHLIQLTSTGHLLLQEARSLLAHMEQSTRIVQETGSGEVGRLTLGFIPAASNEVLPGILREFRAHFPKVELTLREVMPEQAVQRLHDGRIDIGFLLLSGADLDFDYKTVSRELLVVALPEAHPLAAESRIEMRELANASFIMPARYSVPSLYGKVMEVCRQAGFTPNVAQGEVGLMQTTIGLVAGGIGVALVPASLQNLTRKGVVYREVEDLKPTIEMSVLWRPSDNNPVLGSFLGTVDKVAHELANG